MKWAVAVLALFVGLGLLDDYPLVGVGLIVVGLFICWAAIARSGSGSDPRIYRPAQASSAKVTADAERRAAERQAHTLIRAAERRAHRDGQAAVAAARQRIAAEPQWV